MSCNRHLKAFVLHVMLMKLCYSSEAHFWWLVTIAVKHSQMRTGLKGYQT